MPVQMFLMLQGIEGESRDLKHKGEIDVLGWSWGLSGPATSPESGRSTGKATIENMVIQKLVDLSSPPLLTYCAEGRVIASGTLATRRAGANDPDFLIIKLTEVIVVSVAVVETGTAAEPAESVTLGFGKVEFDYSPTLPNGGLGPEKSFRWDIATNRAS
jgi:type VI secretion system secreted protein Hcp